LDVRPKFSRKLPVQTRENPNSNFVSSKVMDFMDEDEDEMPQLVEISDNAQPIPVMILSGFLGSGKTTLLNCILKGNHGLKIAVIENEFSEGLGIEGMIAKSGVNGDNINNFFELNNGCVSFLQKVYEQ
jgi:AAA+ ATPase superfamily predicted ATPase